MITILFIGNNNIGNEGVIAISSALIINQALQNLDLGKVFVLTYTKCDRKQ